MSSNTFTPDPGRLGWKCSSCGELITSIEDGWVEWLATENKRGTLLRDLRLVHGKTKPGDSGSHSCRYDPRIEFRNHKSVVEGLPLERFVGPDGLMLLLSFLAAEEMPQNDVLELIKRVQVPGYEQARELFEAIGKEIFTPSIREGYYLQSEIWALLRWATRDFKPTA
jgi:hypothetical protein